MRVYKNGISREIDESRVQEFREKGYQIEGETILTTEQYQKQIAQLEKENDKLKKEIEKLKKEIEKLKKEVSQQTGGA